MKLIISGSRSFDDYAFLSGVLGEWVERFGKPTQVVSGTANGPDKLGERWAKENGIPVRQFKAAWDVWGKRAGFIRNTEMATYADALIAFWDSASSGTRHMIKEAEDRGLDVTIVVFMRKTPQEEPKP